jgi:alkaline phosphatase
MDTERWILDTVEMDKAVQACIDFQVANPDTLIIVTADHECAGVNIIGASKVSNAELTTRAATAGIGAGVDVNNNGIVDAGDTPGLRVGVVGTYDAAGFPLYAIAADGYPVTMDIDRKFLVAYAASGDRYEDWLTNPNPGVNPAARDTVGNFFIAGQATSAGASSAVHTASDIPLSAGGRGASLFTGVMDNTDVFFQVMQVAIGGAK